MEPTVSQRNKKKTTVCMYEKFKRHFDGQLGNDWDYSDIHINHNKSSKPAKQFFA